MSPLLSSDIFLGLKNGTSAPNFFGTLPISLEFAEQITFEIIDNLAAKIL